MPTVGLRLPRLKSVALKSFSLYSANPNAQFEAGDGVLCLIGANGVGKSTLLTAINYCLTGTVPDPNRAFESMDEYYRYTRNYSKAFFKGRIHPTDEQSAEISITFSIDGEILTITRGMFEPDELRVFDVSGSHMHGVEGEEPSLFTRQERHQQYVETLLKQTGFVSFEEFVFFQHFVFTFDEHRKTLFWSGRVLDRVLYRAFGLEPQMAKTVDTLRREAEQAASQVRNRQWEATRLRRRVNQIKGSARQAQGAQEKYDSLLATHEELSSRFEEELERLHKAEHALKDANNLLADLVVKESALREQYGEFFVGEFGHRAPLSEHPFFVESKSDNQCRMCGSKDAVALSRIEAKRHESTCPLCDSVVTPSAAPEFPPDKLVTIDTEILHIRRRVEEIRHGVPGLEKEVAEARKQWQVTKVQLDKYDEENGASLNALRLAVSAAGTDALLATLKDQLATLENEKQEAYEKREVVNEKLAKLVSQLQRGYRQAEQSFVPRFTELAKKFLGMPIAVQLDLAASNELRLVVSVRGETRREQQHLSESQRFFLDIALRMALIQHMSEVASKGGIYVDTPEGSLDIAYEKRAGDMLAMFASAGHPIVMTANLNSSRLLIELASVCGRSQMRLCRMTDWAELSEVQREEESLFDEAFELIEQALDKNDEAPGS